MHVYVLQRFDGAVKIGKSKQPNTRISAIRNQGGFPSGLVWFSLPVDDASDIERRAHAALSATRMVGEWFDMPFEDAVAAVCSIIETPVYSIAGNEPNVSSLPCRLSFSIKQSGRQQQDLAKKLGVSAGTISHWVAGRHSPDFNQLVQSAEYLGASPAWLAFGVSEESSSAASILDQLTAPQRAQALRMLEAFSASFRETH